VQVRPKTDRHDLETKLGHARNFLEKGHRVRLVMRMRGRENAYGDRWVEHLREIAESLKDVSDVIGAPSAEGRAIALTLQPAGAKSVKQA
jgi:translation initiation factor IF-3